MLLTAVFELISLYAYASLHVSDAVAPHNVPIRNSFVSNVLTSTSETH